MDSRLGLHRPMARAAGWAPPGKWARPEGRAASAPRDRNHSSRRIAYPQVGVRCRIAGNAVCSSGDWDWDWDWEVARPPTAVRRLQRPRLPMALVRCSCSTWQRPPDFAHTHTSRRPTGRPYERPPFRDCDGPAATVLQYRGGIDPAQPDDVLLLDKDAIRRESQDTTPQDNATTQP